MVWNEAAVFHINVFIRTPYISVPLSVSRNPAAHQAQAGFRSQIPPNIRNSKEKEIKGNHIFRSRFRGDMSPMYDDFVILHNR